MSWPAGMRARTQSPTATRESVAGGHAGENPVAHGDAGVAALGDVRRELCAKERVCGCHRGKAAVKAHDAPERHLVNVAAQGAGRLSRRLAEGAPLPSPKALRCRSDGVSSEKAGRSAREERAGRPCWDLPALETLRLREPFWEPFFGARLPMSD